MELRNLRSIIQKGEGLKLEFKRKANHPEKIAREIIAFANTKGGYLLIGVDDDRTIYGTKTPHEDEFAIVNAITKTCFPKIKYTITHIPVNARRAVIAFDIQESKRKPHYIRTGNKPQDKIALIRVEDMSITASREMVQLMKHERNNKGVRFMYGTNERTILTYLEENKKTTLDSAKTLLQISRKQTSITLVTLVRAGILAIHPTQNGDFFTIADNAFE